MLIDANLLLYAVDERAARHRAAVGWLSEQLNGSRRVGLPWQSLAAFLRIGTHPRAFPRPLTPAAAFDIVDLKRRPGNGTMPIRPGHHRLVQQRLRASAQRADFGCGDSPGQRLGKRAAKSIGEPGNRLQNLVVNRLAGPTPQHGAQLVLDVQTIHGRPRRPGRRCRTGCDRPCGRRC